MTAVMGIEPNVLGRIPRLAFRRSGERHRRKQARSASTLRWGRPAQRKKTQPSTSNIGEADRRCTQFDYGQRGPHGPRESESRHPVTNPGLSDLSAKPCQKSPRSARRRARSAFGSGDERPSWQGGSFHFRACLIRVPFSRVLGTLILRWQFGTRWRGVTAGNGWEMACTGNGTYFGARPGQSTPGLRHWPRG